MKFSSILLGAILMIAITDVVNAKSLISPHQTTKPPLTGPSKGTNYTCACGEVSKPVCANNGATYKNKCQMECASNKIPGLRVVKEGDCGKYFSQLQFYSFGK